MFLVEKIPPVFDENSTRKVLLFSTNPFEKAIFEIPMKCKEEKELAQIKNFKEIIELKLDMKKELLDMEEK